MPRIRSRTGSSPTGEPPQAQTTSLLRSAAVIALQWTIGLLLLSGTLHFAGIGPADLHRLSGVRISSLIWAFACTCAASIVVARRWQVTQEHLGGAPHSYGIYLHTFVISRFLGQLSSTILLDVFGRIFGLRRANGGRRASITVLSVLVERGLDLILSFACAAALLLPATLRTLPASFAAFVALSTFGSAAVIPLTVGALRWLHVRGQERGGWQAPRWLSELAADLPTIHSTQFVLHIVTLSFLRLLLVSLQFWWIADSVGLSLSATEIGMATGASQVGAMIGVTPGALGFVEAGWLAALAMLAPQAMQVSAFLLTQRLFQLGTFGLLAAVASLGRLGWPARTDNRS